MNIILINERKHNPTDPEIMMQNLKSLKQLYHDYINDKNYALCSDGRKDPNYRKLRF